MPKADHITAPTQYATSADFRQIFHDEMEGLYLLSFLLTAKHRGGHALASVG